MIYREIGRTGKKAGVIGLGCEYLDGKPYTQVKEVIDSALLGGVNILDVFMPGLTVRENIAKALGDRRKEVMVQGHFGSVDINSQYDISRDLTTVKKYFEDLLRLFGGYIDFGMMFFIDSQDDYKGVFDTGFADYVLKMKEKGYIGHIGFSSHNPETAIKAINTGLPEMMMFSINPAFDMHPVEKYTLDSLGKGMPELRGIVPKRAELYKLCAQKEIGITVMKALGAGKLISAEHTPFKKPMSVNQCFNYALTRPAVACVLPGCKTGEEMQECLNYLSAKDDELDYSGIIDTVQNDFSGSCVYCSHCQPCPAGIDIAAVNKYLDIARLDLANIPPSVRSHYNSLTSGGASCISCGNCEKRCPFNVSIVENMGEAARIFN